jgi:ABC-type phosphate transport system substrate-binding protein
MKITLLPIVMAWLMLMPVMAQGEDMVVVANPHSGIDSLSREEVINIYLGRYRQLASGVSAQPVDSPATHPDKARFYQLLVSKDLAEINAYWSRLIFSGRTTPPRAAKSEEDLLNIIRRTPGAIGYVDRSKIDGRVVLVYELGTLQR